VRNIWKVGGGETNTKIHDVQQKIGFVLVFNE
jgi:hypothetical protein